MYCLLPETLASIYVGCNCDSDDRCLNNISSCAAPVILPSSILKSPRGPFHRTIWTYCDSVRCAAKVDFVARHAVRGNGSAQPEFHFFEHTGILVDGVNRALAI